MPIGAIWQTLLETPLINLMVALSAAAAGSYGAAILLFTMISRTLTFPLTLRTLQSMRALQTSQARQANAMSQRPMPGTFSYFGLVPPAGPGIYWAGSWILGVVLQWVFVGPGDFPWGSLTPSFVPTPLGPGPAAAPKSRTPRR